MKVSVIDVVRQAIKFFFVKQPPVRAAKRRRVAAGESPHAVLVQSRREELMKIRGVAKAPPPEQVWQDTELFRP